MRRALFSRLPIGLVHHLALYPTALLWAGLRFGAGQTEYFRLIRGVTFRHLRSIVFDQMLPKIANYWPTGNGRTANARRRARGRPNGVDQRDVLVRNRTKARRLRGRGGMTPGARPRSQTWAKPDGWPFEVLRCPLTGAELVREGNELVTAVPETHRYRMIRRVFPFLPSSSVPKRRACRKHTTGRSPRPTSRTCTTTYAGVHGLS